MPRPPHIPKFDDIVGPFVTNARRIVDREVTKFANKERTDFVDAIKSQSFHEFKSFPLSWVTLAKKRRYRRGTRTMISTKEYINAIAVHREDQAARGKNWKLRIVIGIDERLPSRDITGKIRKDVSLQMVARIHEFGAPRAHIPARRHWHPWLDSMLPRARLARQEMRRLVVDDWKRRMGVR